MNNRVYSLDVLRGIAVLLVLIVHVAQKTLNYESLGFEVAKLGSLGVQLFFMISAFTVFMTYEKTMLKDRKPITSFFIRRFFRIMPIYWIGIILYSTYYGVYGDRNWGDAPEGWHYILHFLTLNMLHPSVQSTVVPGGWSISVEIMFYLSFPIAFYFVRTLKSSFYFLVATVVLSVFFRMLFTEYFFEEYLYGMMGDSTDEIKSRFVYRFIINQYPLFAAGFFMYHMIKSGQYNKYIDEKLILLSTFSFLIISLYVFLVYSGSFLKLPLEAFVHIVIGFPMLILSIVYLVRKAKSSPCLLEIAFASIGRVSFSFYIVHFIIVDEVSRAVIGVNESFGMSFGFLFISTIFLSLVITYSISNVSHFFIEKKIQNFTKTVLARFKFS
ncbi:acyltransferase [Alishewanella agri BL06]|uniref:Acyltransferase n=1 Tax=Alishewanella agri BL06 TaxID=1195246 RepID=I9DRZ5_9ALTE|nr:acyltransferase [Alishewanella agri]EIW88835.1 acyltransferase [Alishewanella agri BL06]